MLARRGRVDILKSHHRFFALGRKFFFNLILRTTFRFARAALLRWKQMLSAANRSRYIVNQILVLFPFAGFRRSHTIRHYVVVWIARFESLIQRKAAEVLASRVSLPVAQSV